jgi:hypothetical protein
VRIRIGNLSMTNHPIHLHGHEFTITGTDGGPVPPTMRWPEITADIAVGQMRQLEFLADEPGDWALHCHKSHHTMNAMGHDITNTVGVTQADLASRINRVIPGYMAMGSHGMADMARMQMPLPANTAPMMMGEGPFGPLEMGGMFTLLKVRDKLPEGDYRDPGWYRHPEGTVAREWNAQAVAPTAHAPHTRRHAPADTASGEWQAVRPGASSHDGH